MDNEAVEPGDVPRILIDAVLSNRDEAMAVVRGRDIVEANDALLRLTGRKRKEIIRQPYNALLSPASSAMVDQQLASLAAGEQVVPSQVYEVVHSKGNTMLLEALVLGWPTDRLLSVMLLRDVTSREETISALKESEKLYRVLAENIPAGITLAHCSGRTLYVNERLVEISGYSVEELMGPIWFLHPDDTLGLELCELAFAGRKASPLHETRIITKDGRERWVSVLFLPLRGPDGEFEVVLTVWQDITDRKLAEERLHFNEHFLQTVFDGIQDGISVSDANLNILSTNQWMEKTYGHKMPLRGRKCYEVFRGRQEPCEQCPSVRAMETGLPQMELWPFLNEGHEQVGWVELRAFPLVDDKGEIWGVVEYIRDVTARKLAEEQLRETEERFRLLAENASDLIWQMDPTGVFTYMSPSVSRYGYSPEEWIGRTLDSFIHPDERELCHQRLQADTSGAAPRLYEVRMLRKSGEVVWVEVIIDVVIRDGKPFRMQGVSRDITERKASEEALRESEEKYRSIVESTSDMILLSDQDVRTIYVSPACRGILGYEPEELIAHWMRVVHPDDKETVLAARERAARGESGKMLFYRLLAKSGETKWVSHSWSPIMRDGKLHLVVSVVRDVTERMLNDLALQEAHEALERAHELQSEFLNNVTHEVRTPLTAVQGYAKMLLEGLAGSLNEEQSGLLKKALASADNLLGIVDSVLEITRFRSGQIDLRTAVCKPGEIARNAVSTVYAQARVKGIDLQAATPERDCVGIYDEAKLMLILTNLLSNAVKFTETGGVRIVVECNSSGAEFIVTDTGMGIDSDDVPAVFEEFVQGSDRHRHKPQGFGVGLALVNALVRAIDGTLILSSSKGLGTAITLYVPVLDAP